MVTILKITHGEYTRLILEDGSDEIGQNLYENLKWSCLEASKNDEIPRKETEGFLTKKSKLAKIVKLLEDASGMKLYNFKHSDQIATSKGDLRVFGQGEYQDNENPWNNYPSKLANLFDK